MIFYNVIGTACSTFPVQGGETFCHNVKCGEAEGVIVTKPCADSDLVEWKVSERQLFNSHIPIGPNLRAQKGSTKGARAEMD